MKTTWQKTFKAAQKYPPLEKDIFVDVAIVGGGITGTTLAYLLSKSGKKVAVLEAGTLEESSYTAYTTAFITYEVDTDFQDLENIFGKNGAQDVWQSGLEAIDKIEQIIREEKIDCEFARCPMFFYANDAKEWEIVHEEAKRGQGLGFDIYLETDAKRAVLKNQAKFHPLKYVDGLRVAAAKMGALFYENTKVKEIIEGERPVVLTEKNKVTADYAAVCTYKPFNNPKRVFGRKGMYKSYIYELAIEGGVFPEGLYLDAYNPYHYFRIDKGAGSGERDRMIIGGEDHRIELKMKEEKNFRSLLKYAERVLGEHRYEVVTKWAGGILETIDGLPYIGQYSKKHPNLLLATGFSGNGMTYSMIAGTILHDKILGIKNKYEYLYTPLRGYSWSAFFIKGRDYVGELFGGAVKNIFKKK
jgi:glycine/D-amino acid oxidase-like deaminating enzyme